MKFEVDVMQLIIASDPERPRALSTVHRPPSICVKVAGVPCSTMRPCSMTMTLSQANRLVNR